LEKTLTNLPSPGISAYKFREGDPIVYCIRQRGWNTTIPYRLAVNELIKWDYSKVTGNNWTTGIVWNVSLKQPDGTGPGEGERTSSFLIYGNKAVVTTYNEDKAYMYDTDTGQQLMVKDFGYPNTYRPSWSEDGVIITFDSVERQLHAYDFETLNELWVTEPFPYPWGSNVRYPTWAYGNFYVATYDGHIYCFDEDTGVMKWKFYCGNTTETVFKSFVPYLGAVSRPIVADGKVFMGTSEHTPTQPRIRFNKLFCVDAITGDHLWSISGAMETIVGQGYLVGANENDGCMYAFSKGKTETTVEAPLMPVAAGERITIRGTVMDMSPAQPGTPAVSDECMGPWMEYLHMQKPMPYPTGVPVKLIVIHPDGNVEWIYTRTTDMYGNFAHAYEPPTEGIYKIIASFDGSESYWPSVAETAIGVGPGPSPAQQFSWQELAKAPITTELAIIAAVAIAVVTGVVSYWMLKKRQ
jgi:hypothetical protein